MKGRNFYILGLLLIPCMLLGVQKKGYLGIYHKDLSEAVQLAIGVDHGVITTEVVAESPADSAGVKVGDVLVAIDGETIEDEDAFVEILGEKPNQLVEITIIRQGKELKLKAQLGEKTPGEEVEFPWDSEVAGKGIDFVREGLLVPITFFIMVSLITIMAFYFRYRIRMLQSKERMAAIEKGIALTPEPVRPLKDTTPLNTLRKGFVCSGIGLGLIIFSIIDKDISSWTMGGGLIVGFIGVALVLWYLITRKKA